MNGDLGTVYREVLNNGKKLAALEATHISNHEANQRDISRLYKWMWALSFFIVSGSLTMVLAVAAQ